MTRSRQYRWLIAMGIGLVGGLILSGLWPHTPLYAVATDRVDTFAMATGPLDYRCRGRLLSRFPDRRSHRRGAGKATEDVDRLLQYECLRRSGRRSAEESQVYDGHGRGCRSGAGEAAASSLAPRCATWRRSPAAGSRPTQCPGRPTCIHSGQMQSGPLRLVRASPASAKSPARPPPPSPARATRRATRETAIDAGNHASHR